MVRWLRGVAGPGAGPGSGDDGVPFAYGFTAAVAWDAWRALREGPAGIEARQLNRLGLLVDYAREHSRFYRERYRDLPAGPVQLRRLPAVSKSELMSRFDDWVTDPAITRTTVEAFVADLDNLGADFLDRYVVFTTSGSTGVPALLVQDRRALAVMNGLAIVRSAGWLTPRVLARVLARGARQAAVFATGGHFLTTTMIARRLRLRPFRRRIVRFYSVLDPLPRLVEQLNAFRPALLGSYASVLGVLAEEQRAGRLRISPAVIGSGGELLSPAVRRQVESAFGCPVAETYSASEATPLALPCRHGRLHVNSDWFLLEPVDAAGAPTAPGELSHSLLLTNLANLAQPLIRYELGDSVVMPAEPCPCASPLPTIRVEGRTEDILQVPRPDGTRVALLPMALATVVEETPGVHRFQIVQTAPTTLAVRLEGGPGTAREQVWAAVRARLADYLTRQGLPAVDLELAAEAPMLSPRGGKLRHVLAAPHPACAP